MEKQDRQDFQFKTNFVDRYPQNRRRTPPPHFSHEAQTTPQGIRSIDENLHKTNTLQGAQDSSKH